MLLASANLETQTSTQSLEWYNGAIRAAATKGMSLRAAELAKARAIFIENQKARRH